MKKKTTAKRKKAMLRKMKKQIIKNERKNILNERLIDFSNSSEKETITQFTKVELLEYINKAKKEITTLVNDKIQKAKIKKKTFKNFISTTINKLFDMINQTKSISINSILKNAKNYLLKTAKLIKQEKRNICVALSAVITVNSASVKSSSELFLGPSYEKTVIPIEDTTLSLPLHALEEDIEFLDVQPSIESETETQLLESDNTYSENLITTFEKEQAVMDKENLTMEKLYTLLDLMLIGNSPFVKAFNSCEEALDYLYESEYRTYEDMMLIIMARDGYCYNELDAVCAGCVAEARGGGTCYIDAYAVASVFLNRTNYIPYINSHTVNYYTQFVAPNQFQVYDNETYLDFLGRIDLPGYQAAIDAFYSKLSMHDYLEFRGSWVDVKKYEQFVSGGNKYLVRMKEQNIVSQSEETKEEVMTLVLKNNNTEYVDY